MVYAIKLYHSIHKKTRKTAMYKEGK